VPHHEHENTDSIVQPIPDPSLDDTAIEEEPAKSKKSGAGKTVVLIGLLMCVLGVGSGLAYKFCLKKDGPPANDS